MFKIPKLNILNKKNKGEKIKTAEEKLSSVSYYKTKKVDLLAMREKYSEGSANYEKINAAIVEADKKINEALINELGKKIDATVLREKVIQEKVDRLKRPLDQYELYEKAKKMYKEISEDMMSIGGVAAVGSLIVGLADMLYFSPGVVSSNQIAALSSLALSAGLAAYGYGVGKFGEYTTDKRRENGSFKDEAKELFSKYIEQKNLIRARVKAGYNK